MKNIWLGQNGRPGAMAVVPEVLYIIPNDFVKRVVITFTWLQFCFANPWGLITGHITVYLRSHGNKAGARPINVNWVRKRVCVCVCAHAFLCVILLASIFIHWNLGSSGLLAMAAVVAAGVVVAAVAVVMMVVLMMTDDRVRCLVIHSLFLRFPPWKKEWPTDQSTDQPTSQPTNQPIDGQTLV